MHDGRSVASKRSRIEPYMGHATQLAKFARAKSAFTSGAPGASIRPPSECTEVSPSCVSRHRLQIRPKRALHAAYPRCLEEVVNRSWTAPVVANRLDGPSIPILFLYFRQSASRART